MSFLSRAFTGARESRTLTSASWLNNQMDANMAPSWATMPGEYTRHGDAMGLSAFYACVTLLADIIASLDLKAYRMKDGVLTVADPQPTLFKNSPWPDVTWFSWLWMMMESAAITGNGFGYIHSFDDYGKASSIMPVHPDFVSISITDFQGTKWPRPLYTILGTEVPQERMLHIKRYPLAGFAWGMSPVQKAASTIGLGLAAQRYGIRYFEDSANPSGILTTEQDLSVEQSKQNMKRWIQSHQGRRLPAMLSGGLQWQPIQITPEESQFLQCVVPGTLVTLANGTRVPVESLRVGDSVQAWNGSKLEAAKVAAVGTPPIKPLIRIKTARGRELTATSDHPVLGLRRMRTPGCRPLPSYDGEWISIGDLEVGNYVRVALGSLPDASEPTMSADEAYFLGAMVGDGYIRASGPSWASTDSGVIAKMSDVTSELGGSISHRGGCDFSVRMGPGTKANQSRIRRLLNESGLIGTHSHDKFVPDSVIAGGAPVWRAFLSGYLDADGSVRDPDGKQNAAVYWSSTSKTLLEGSQHLLALLGIQSAIYPMHQGGIKTIFGRVVETRPSWGLYVMGQSQLKQLAYELEPAHSVKASRLAAYRDSEPSGYQSANFDYDRVVEVVELGPGETVGVEIEDLHTHVTGGIITHNTRANQISEVARFFRIPPHMIGDSTKATSWGSGIESLSLGFVTYTLKPWLKSIEQEITRLLPGSLQAKFNLDELLLTDLGSRWESYRVGRDSGVYSVNDILKMEGRKTIGEIGDIHLQPANFIPLGQENTNPIPTHDPQPAIKPFNKPKPADNEDDGED